MFKFGELTLFLPNLELSLEDVFAHESAGTFTGSYLRTKLADPLIGLPHNLIRHKIILILSQIRKD